jgi:hypothetical protein
VASFQLISWPPLGDSYANGVESSHAPPFWAAALYAAQEGLFVNVGLLMTPCSGSFSLSYWATHNVHGLITVRILFYTIDGLGIAQNKSSAPALSWVVGGVLRVNVFFAGVITNSMSYALVSEIPSLLLRSHYVAVARFSFACSKIVANIITSNQLNPTAWAWGAPCSLGFLLGRGFCPGVELCLFVRVRVERLDCCRAGSVIRKTSAGVEICSGRGEPDRGEFRDEGQHPWVRSQTYDCQDCYLSCCIFSLNWRIS